MADFSLIKFFQQFPNEEKAAKYFEKLRWGEVVICPYYGSVHISRTKLMPYRCRDCRKHFSVRTGTALAESRLPLQKVSTSSEGDADINIHNVLSDNNVISIYGKTYSLKNTTPL